MTEKKGTFIVTGANGGLGSAIVSQIVSSPQLSASYHGLYMVRNAATAHALDTALAAPSSPKQDSGVSSHSHEKVSLDLTQLSNVRKVAADINERVAAGTIPRIHALVLNAGYEEYTSQTWTEDGWDLTFAANYLGHWLLTVLLLQSMDPEVGRVLWVSSFAHYPDDPQTAWNGAYKKDEHKIIFDSDSIDPVAKGTWSSNKDDTTGWAAGFRRYGASKLCGVTSVTELQRRLDQDSKLSNIAVLGIDPRVVVNTDIVRRHGSWFFRVIIWRNVLPAIAAVMSLWSSNAALRSAKKSAEQVIVAALENGPPPLSARPKDLYLNGSELGIRNPEAKDPAKGAMLWRDTLRYTQLKEGETCLENWR